MGTGNFWNHASTLVLLACMDNPWSPSSPTQEAPEGSSQAAHRRIKPPRPHSPFSTTPAGRALCSLWGRGQVWSPPTSGVQSLVATLPNLQGKVRELENFSHSNNPERAIKEYTLSQKDMSLQKEGGEGTFKLNRKH